MFGLLVRRFAGVDGRPGRAVRFTPGLETLDGRVLPGGLNGGVVGSVYELNAGRGGISGDCVLGGHAVLSGLRGGEEIPTLARNIGEEIPSVAGSIGEEIPTLTRSIGEEIPSLTRSKGEEIPTPVSSRENGSDSGPVLLGSKLGVGTDGAWDLTLHGTQVEPLAGRGGICGDC